MKKQKTKRKGPSPYAAKRARGDMMYGPGCCAHKSHPPFVGGDRRREKP